MQEHVFVIPAYNDSHYLEDCIISLKNQREYSNIIVTTATPSAYIGNLAQKHNLLYFVNQNPPSISGDWNFGLDKANAKFVTIAHQDDIYEKEFSTEVVSAMKRKSDCLICFTDYIETADNVVFRNSLNLIIKRILLLPFYMSRNIKNRFVKRSVLSIGNPICCPSVTINKSLAKDFNFSNEYLCALDWQAWLELADRKGSFIYINKKLLRHRIHKASETTSQIENGRRLQEEKKILQRIWGKSIGSFISTLYKFGQKGNLTKA